ncbi:unnamed protein product [Rotaria sordida]|uniref:Uncharacterized protein n=1 Tax=Rotaria sordida TaxID=392033 RepID=A0A815C7H1_9BILA|nr:unnamed protein product [Rotaria sordida]
MASSSTELCTDHEDNLAKDKERHNNYIQNQYDGRISGVIDKAWISSFVNDAFNMHKLRKIDSIEPIPFQFLTKNLKRKLQYKSKDSQTKRKSSKFKNLIFDWSDDDDTEYELTSTFFKV